MEHLGKVLKHRSATGKLASIHSRRAYNHGAGLSHTAGYACLSTTLGAVGYFYVTGYAYLTAKHAPLPYLRRTRHAYLRRHDCVAAYIAVVGYLHKVVELHAAAHYGRAHDGAVNAGVGTYLYIVLYNGIAYLGNLLVALSRGSKAKTVGTNAASTVKNYVSAHYAVMIYRHVGIENRALADLGIFLHYDVGIELSTIAYHYAFAHIDERSYIDILAYGGTLGYHGCGMYAGAAGSSLLVNGQQPA